MTNKIVLFRQFGTTLPEELTKLIYNNLNDSEKQEIDKRIRETPYLTQKTCIEALYGTLSFRRRMNPRFVEAVQKYIKKKDCALLQIAEITGDKFYIYFDDIGEVVSNFPQTEFDEPELVKTWINQITVEEEMEKPEKDISTYNLKDIKQKDSLRIKLKKIRNKIIRKILKIKSKNITNTYKQLKEESNGRSKKKRFK